MRPRARRDLWPLQSSQHRSAIGAGIALVHARLKHCAFQFQGGQFARHFPIQLAGRVAAQRRQRFALARHSLHCACSWRGASAAICRAPLSNRSSRARRSALTLARSSGKTRACAPARAGRTAALRPFPDRRGGNPTHPDSLPRLAALRPRHPVARDRASSGGPAALRPRPLPRPASVLRPKQPFGPSSDRASRARATSARSFCAPCIRRRRHQGWLPRPVRGSARPTP
jgi:hypothetical protein